MLECGIRMRDVVAKPCPFCGAKGKVKCESRKRVVYRNDFGEVVEYRTYHIRCTVCNARGGTVGGLVGRDTETEKVKICGIYVTVHTDGYFERQALRKWNRRSDDDKR